MKKYEYGLLIRCAALWLEAHGRLQPEGEEV
jgi:hypothetical protein